MILISFGLGNFLIACIAILLGGAIFKLVKKGASIILILLPIALITAGIGMVLSIFGAMIDYIAFSVVLIVYFYKRHKIPKEIRKAERGKIAKIFFKTLIIILHLLSLLVMPIVPHVTIGFIIINLLLFALVITTDKKNKNY